jgi:hypothetical protein
VDRSGPGGFELAPARVDPDRIAGEQLILDGDLEDLAEAGDRLVDRLCGERRLVDLALAVPVDLGDRDLGEPMAREDRQEVVAELPLVVENGIGRPLAPMGVEPLAREHVERRVRLDLNFEPRSGRAPDPAANVGEHIPELILGTRPAPTVCCRSKGDVAALAVRAEAQRVGRTARGALLDDRAGRSSSCSS